MPNPDDPSEEALSRLDRDLTAFEAKRSRKARGEGNRELGMGYRFLGEVVGGVLGGLGLGWLLDRYAGTTPFGVIGGVLIGLSFSIFIVVRGASRMADEASKAAGPLPSVPDDEDD